MPIFLFLAIVAIVAGGAGYAKLKFEEHKQAQNQLLMQMSAIRKEKLIALDMLKERDEELTLYRSQSEKLQEGLEKQSDVVEKQKVAAKKLAELLAKTQKERESFKSERDTLSRPDSLPCIEAISAKDNAIAALLGERSVADKSISQLKMQVKKEEKKRDAVVSQLNERETDLDALRTWKESATVELENLQAGTRTASIWQAAVDQRTKDACPEPVPPILKIEDLAGLLQKEKLKVGAELGCGITNQSTVLLKNWPLASTFHCILTSEEATPAKKRSVTLEEEEEEKPATATMSEAEANVRLMQTLPAQVVVSQFNRTSSRSFKEDSLDVVHFAAPYDHALYDDALLLETLEQFWKKTRLGGVLVGGLVKHDVATPRQRKLAALNAVEAFARRKHRQMAKYGTGTWAIRK